MNVLILAPPICRDTEISMEHAYRPPAHAIVVLPYPRKYILRCQISFPPFLQGNLAVSSAIIQQFTDRRKNGIHLFFSYQVLATCIYMKHGLMRKVCQWLPKLLTIISLFHGDHESTSMTKQRQLNYVSISRIHSSLHPVY